MGKNYMAPEINMIPCNLSDPGVLQDMTDAELKILMEKGGYQFTKTFQVNLLNTGAEVLHEMDALQKELWEMMKKPVRCSELEYKLEEAHCFTHKKAVETVLAFLKELQEKEMVIVR